MPHSGTPTMAMSSVYRLREPVTVLVKNANSHKLQQLPAGSLLRVDNSKPDASGLIAAACNGNSVQIFSRDLEERSDSIGTVYGGGDASL